MNLGQTLITTGMLVLLIMSVFSANRMLMEINQATYEAEATAASATIAADLIDEILTKKFDKFSDTTGTQDPSDFSPPTTGSVEWGPSTSERLAVGSYDTSSTNNYKSRMYFNDADDYIGYVRPVTMNYISGFTATVQVYYISPFEPDVPLTYRSYYKKIDVAVQHPLYVPTPVIYTGLASY